MANGLWQVLVPSTFLEKYTIEEKKKEIWGRKRKENNVRNSCHKCSNAGMLTAFANLIHFDFMDMKNYLKGIFRDVLQIVTCDSLINKDII